MENSIIITGAAQGIGLATAKLFDDQGWALTMVDLQEIDCSKYHRAISMCGDITDEEFVNQTITKTVKNHGRLDALVNNAGISCISPATNTSSAIFRRVLEVNLIAPFLLARECGTQMLGSGGGAIVNVASVAGLLGVADRVAYNSSKHGLIGMTRTLAAEWGGRGVRVNAVCPGWVKTEMDDRDQSSGSYTDFDITSHIPMGRFATPRDVAEAIFWLCDSHRSGFINGVTLPVDGGWTSDGSWHSLKLKQRPSDT